MKTRKLVLIIADIILLAVLIGQCVLMSRDGGKTFRLKETPDEILIQNGGEEVLLRFDNNQWVVGEEKYPTNTSTVDAILDSIQYVRCLDKVGSTSKTGALEKYELRDDEKISVTAKKEGAVIRQLDIGKAGATGSQNFITVDGGNDIYLATGGLRYDFDTSMDQIRSKIVWDFDEAEINAVEVEKFADINDINVGSNSDEEENWNSGKNFKVAKTGSGEELQWTLTSSDEETSSIDVDGSKVQSWFDSLGSLTTSKWYDESKDLEEEFSSKKVATTKISHGNRASFIDIYQIPGDGGDKTPKYYGKSNETPYPFELSLYTMEKINKNPEELAK